MNIAVITGASSGLGKEYASELAKKIQERTGIETKFARFAHIVRGGTPTLRDRVLASKMGTYAVDKLLKGESNIVICERNGDIVSNDIGYALDLDAFYKGKITESDLSYDAATIEKMKAECAERRSVIEEWNAIGNMVSL